jgi:hypothetical protein
MERRREMKLFFSSCNRVKHLSLGFYKIKYCRCAILDFTKFTTLFAFRDIFTVTMPTPTIPSTF